MRRLGGSRWRLRRTRCAMGFERQRGFEQSLRRTARCGGNAVWMVGGAAEMSKREWGKLRERWWRRSGHTMVLRRGRAQPWAVSGGPAAVNLCITIIVLPQRGQSQRDAASARSLFSSSFCKLRRSTGAFYFRSSIFFFAKPIPASSAASAEE
jgi:hypothetical protein